MADRESDRKREIEKDGTLLLKRSKEIQKV